MPLRLPGTKLQNILVLIFSHRVQWWLKSYFLKTNKKHQWDEITSLASNANPGLHFHLVIWFNIFFTSFRIINVSYSFVSKLNHNLLADVFTYFMLSLIPKCLSAWLTCRLIQTWGRRLIHSFWLLRFDQIRNGDVWIMTNIFLYKICFKDEAKQWRNLCLFDLNGAEHRFSTGADKTSCQ